MHDRVTAVCRGRLGLVFRTNRLRLHDAGREPPGRMRHVRNGHANLRSRWDVVRDRHVLRRGRVRARPPGDARIADVRRGTASLPGKLRVASLDDDDRIR